MANPPQHSASAEIIYIPSSDPAWDTRYAQEIEALSEAKGDAHDHPLVKYLTGLTRFDLDATGTIVTGKGEDGATTFGLATPRDYLRPEVTPRKFILRRLRSIEVADCQNYRLATCWVMACMHALLKVEGVEGFKLSRRKDVVEMGDEALDELRDAIGISVIYEIGKAALAASSAPTEQEKKA